MKKVNKYILGATILSCLVLGFFLAKPLISLIQPTATIVDEPDAIYMARDLTVYSQRADLIVIGNVREVNDPYVTGRNSITLQQDAQIDVQEVLKGDSAMKNVEVSGLAAQIEGFSPENLSALRGKTGLLKPGEKVLLFLGRINTGEYVVFAGPYGKYLIDRSNNVSSEGDFKMSLDELKKQIQTALRVQVPPYTPPKLSEQI